MGSQGPQSPFDIAGGPKDSAKAGGEVGNIALQSGARLRSLLAGA
jgi:hypothetical protein